MADTATVEQGNGTVDVNAQDNRTFTQDEVNAIVGKRLEKENAKYSDYEELKAKASKLDEIEEANKSELQKATEKAEALQAQIDSMTKANEIRNIRAKISAESNIPADVLIGDTEEECRAYAERLNAWHSSVPGYPTVKDGGETKSPGVTKEDILSIKNEKERLKAIQEHIELF